MAMEMLTFQGLQAFGIKEPLFSRGANLRIDAPHVYNTEDSSPLRLNVEGAGIPEITYQYILNSRGMQSGIVVSYGYITTIFFNDVAGNTIISLSGVELELGYPVH